MCPFKAEIKTPQVIFGKVSSPRERVVHREVLRGGIPPGHKTFFCSDMNPVFSSKNNLGSLYRNKFQKEKAYSMWGNKLEAVSFGICKPPNRLITPIR